MTKVCTDDSLSLKIYKILKEGGAVSEQRTRKTSYIFGKAYDMVEMRDV